MRHPDADGFAKSLRAAAADLEALAVPGARVELKSATLTWHYRDVEAGRRAAAREAAITLLKHRGLRVVEGKMAVEARPSDAWHKGYAVLWLLRRRHGADWPSRTRALYVGDDATDEDAFRTLRGIGRSICVGPQPPSSGRLADYWLPDPAAVVQLVRWLASGGFAPERPWDISHSSDTASSATSTALRS